MKKQRQKREQAPRERNAERKQQTATLVSGDPVFEEVDMFKTALIQGACVESPRAD